ncbi:peptidylprolyl isomerase [Actinocorallia longicatena]|uniref:Peptidyl-prolyl cis-trans isomerase n=1 Tax=Actinocorallia longicatena TaxID=111803 RepID=A0ABP6Q8E9_9ACTN
MAGKDRNKQLARERFERQQARRQAEEAKAKRQRMIGSVAAAVVVIGAGAAAFALTRGDDDDKTTVSPSASTTPSESAKPVAAGECAFTPDGKAAKDVGLPAAKPTAKGDVQATLKMNIGDVKVELDGKNAPCTVSSFQYLAGKGYFDKTKCHRMTPNVLQCGDPSATGSGGPGYKFANENTKDAKYKKGVLAMANSGADTNGSQFFIVYKDWDDLPADYTVFGKVTGGMDKIEAVAAKGIEPADATGNTAPKQKVEINSVTIAK